MSLCPKDESITGECLVEVLRPNLNVDGATPYRPLLPRYLLRRNQIRANKAIRPTTPPTVPPAIAPAWLSLASLIGDSVADDVGRDVEDDAEVGFGVGVIVGGTD